MSESVGPLLRQEREARGLTLEDVERATRIRVKYLAAIEAGEFEAIPSAAQARGFLRNYAQYLGLDADEVLAVYDAPARRASLGDLARVLVRPRRSPPAPPASPVPPPAAPAALPPPFVQPLARPRRSLGLTIRRLRWLSADVIVGLVVVAGLLGFFAWGSTRLASVLFRATAKATPIKLGRPEPTLTPGASLAPTTAAGDATLLPTAPAQLLALTDVPITLKFEQTAWVLVIVDGSEAFRGLAGPGATQDYLGQTSVEVFTANGAGVRVNYGGADLGPMGAFGEVVYRIYTLNGIVTPTASPTLEVTDTHTPRPVTDTPTPRPTPSPRASEPVTGTPTLPPTATIRPTETVPPSPTSQPSSAP